MKQIKILNTTTHLKTKNNSFGIACYLLILILSSFAVRAQWTPVNTGLPNTYTNGIGNLAVNGNSLFVGTSQGMYMSGDNGNTWSLFALSGYSVGQISFSGPKIFALASGIRLSQDNGSTWSNVTNGVTNMVTVMSSGSVTYVGTQGGMAISSNNGASWNYPSGITGCIFSFFAANNTVFAGGCSAIYSSTNSGTSWSYSYSEITNCFTALNNNIFAGTFNGIYMSSDNGNSWTAKNNGIMPDHITALVSSGSDIFAGGNGSGVFYSSNNGDSWTINNAGLTDTYIWSLAICGSYIFAETLSQGVFRRPLGEFVGIHEFSDKPFPFVLFPNPNNGSFKITLNQPTEGNLKLYNSIGEKVHEQKINGNEHEINIDKPVPGLYECTLEMKNGTILRNRVIIEN
jgi:photosystem II stability/assembly factor-like uncharacterized protein